MDVSLSELRVLVMDREAWRAAFMGSQSQTRLSDWTELKVPVCKGGLTFHIMYVSVIQEMHDSGDDGNEAETKGELTTMESL